METPPPPTQPKKSTRGLGVLLIVVGAVILLYGVTKMLNADSAYLAGRAMGHATIGAICAGAGVILVRK